MRYCIQKNTCSGILSFWENYVIWLLRHQMINEWGCWDSKTFLSFAFMKGRILLRCSGYCEPKKMTPNCNALAKLIISYLTFVFSWQCKTMLFTKKHAVMPYERAHSIILESPVSTPLSNQQTFVHIELLFLVEKLSY